jgi:hypothetical protein
MAYYVDTDGEVLPYIGCPDGILLLDGRILKDTDEVNTRLFATTEAANKFGELVKDNPSTARARFRDWLDSLKDRR